MNITANKQEELVDFLKNRSIFQVLDRQILDSLSELFSEFDCGPGQIVFQEGDEADALYVIRNGSVAVLQNRDPSNVIAYLTPGDCFGEMAIINETTRSATIRVPEEASLLRLPKSAVKELTQKFPAITTEIAKLINKRTSGDILFKPPGLTGNLAFFDLPTVIQAVLNSRNGGALNLYGRSRKIIGQILILENRIVKAAYEELKGEAALYELMNLTEPLDFTFEHQAVDSKNADHDLLQRSPQMLLIEAARRADELPKLMSTINWTSAVYELNQSTTDLKLNKNDQQVLCEKICAVIGSGQDIKEMRNELPYDKYSILNAINELLKLKVLKASKHKNQNDLRESPLRSKPLDEDTISAEFVDNPFELVKIVNAINGISTNLGLIYGKDKIRLILNEALNKACKNYPNLASINARIDAPALDLRHANSDFSESKSTIPGLLHLSNLLLELSSNMQKQEN